VAHKKVEHMWFICLWFRKRLTSITAAKCGHVEHLFD